MWEKAGDFSDWWDEQHQLSKEALDAFVDEHPDFFGVVVSGTFNTSMDLAEPTVDMWRFGAGFAEGPGGAVKDGFRFLGLMGPLGTVGRGAAWAERQVVAEGEQAAKIANNLRLSELIADIPKDHLKAVRNTLGEDHLCWAVTSTKALVQSGQKLYASVKDFAKEIGHPFDPLELDSLDTVRPDMEKWLGLLRKIGAKVSDKVAVKTFEDVVALVPRQGVVLVEILGRNFKNEIYRHAIHVYRDVAGVIRIVNRDGRIVSSLQELGGTIDPWQVKSAAVLENVVVKEVAKAGAFERAADTAYRTGVVAMAVKAATGFSRKTNETIAQVFEMFKQSRQGGTLLGSGIRHVVGPGETLQDIARTYYGDETKWPIVMEANRDRIAASGNPISESQRLVIPELPHVRQFGRLGETPKPQLVRDVSRPEPPGQVMPPPSGHGLPRLAEVNATGGKPSAAPDAVAGGQHDRSRSNDPLPSRIAEVEDIPLDVLQQLSNGVDRSLEALEPSQDSPRTARMLELQLDDLAYAASRASELEAGRALYNEVKAIREKHYEKLRTADDEFGHHDRPEDPEPPRRLNEEGWKAQQANDARRGDNRNQARIDDNQALQDADRSADEEIRARRATEQASRDEADHRKSLERETQQRLQEQAAERLEREQKAEAQRRDEEARARIDAIHAELQALDRRKAEEREHEAAVRIEPETSSADQREREAQEAQRIAREDDAKHRAQLEKERMELETQIRLRVDAANKARIEEETRARESARLAEEARVQLVTTARLYLADRPKQAPARDDSSTDGRQAQDRIGTEPRGADARPDRDDVDRRRQQVELKDQAAAKQREDDRRRWEEAAAKQIEQQNKHPVSDAQRDRERWQTEQADLARTLEQARIGQQQADDKRRDQDGRRRQEQDNREYDLRRQQDIEARQRDEERRREEDAQARQREEERQAREQAEARQAEELRKSQEDAEARQREEERRRQEEFDMRQREEELRRQEEAEARQRAEEEKKRAEEEEQRRQQDIEARQREDERRRLEEAEARRREEERRQHEDEERKKREEEIAAQRNLGDDPAQTNLTGKIRVPGSGWKSYD